MYIILSFKNLGTEDIFNGKTIRARKTCPEQLWKIARRKLDQLDSAATIEDLSIPPGDKLETLKGDRKAQYSTMKKEENVLREIQQLRFKIWRAFT